MGVLAGVIQQGAKVAIQTAAGRFVHAHLAHPTTG